MPKYRWRWIRWTLWLLLAALGLLVGSYAWLTHPDRLRPQALAALAANGLPQADIAEVSFSPTEGLRLVGLRLGGADETPGSQPPVHIGHAHVRVRPWPLLSGRVEPTRITIDDAHLVMRSPGTGSADAALPASLKSSTARLGQLLEQWSGPLPPIDIVRADVQVVADTGARVQTVERAILRASGAPTPAGYRLSIERLPLAAGPLADVQWDRAAGTLALTLNWSEINTITRTLPRRITTVLDDWQLAGQVRVERLEFAFVEEVADNEDVPLPAMKLNALVLHGQHLSGVLPVEESPADGNAPPRFLHFSDATARLACAGPLASRSHGTPLELELEGQLNDARVKAAAELSCHLLRGMLAPLERTNEQSPENLRSAHISIEGLTLPTEATAPALLRSERLHGAVRAAFRDYQPEGRVNLQFALAPPGGNNDAARLSGEIEALGTACTYAKFPYAFTDAWGRVRIADGQILLEGLCAQHQGARVCVNGKLNNSHQWTGFELTFEGQNVPLDYDLYAALPEEYRTLWQSARPLGLCDVITTVQRPEGSAATGPLDPDVHVRAQMLNGSLALEDERRITDVRGLLEVHNGIVQIDALYGRDGPASVRLDGELWQDEDGPVSDFRIEVHDLPVSEALTMGAAGTTPGASVRFRGKADAWGRVHERGARTERHFAVHLHDGMLQALDPQRQWTAAEGWVIERNGAYELVSFSCRQGDAWFDAAGLVPSGDRPGAPLQLVLRARSDELAELWPQFIPPAWADLAQAIGLAGAGEVAVALQPSESAGGAEDQSANIRVQAGRMQADALPLPLKDVQAHLFIAPGKFELHHSGAHWGTAGAITASGTGTWEGQRLDAEVSLIARGMAFTDELTAAMPTPLRSLLEKLAAEGEFDALLHRVQVSGEPAQRTWAFEGRLPLRQAKLHLGLVLEETDGELYGTCIAHPDGEVELDAEVSIRKGTLAGRPIREWRGLLRRGIADRWVRLEDLRGKLCGGQAIGSVWIDPKTAEYELSLTLKDVRVADIMTAPNQSEPSTATGFIDGEIHLRGRGNAVGSRRGGGNLRLRGGSFLDTPVLRSVSEAEAKHQAAMQEMIDRADIRFLWEGSLIRLTRVDIQSQNLRMIGNGVWDRRADTINLTLVAAHPRHWPRILMISDLIEATGQELVQYHVTGPRSQPRVAAEPLYKLNETLKALITGESE